LADPDDSVSDTTQLDDSGLVPARTRPTSGQAEPVPNGLLVDWHRVGNDCP
jgi:hypothetical protein